MQIFHLCNRLILKLWLVDDENLIQDSNTGKMAGWCKNGPTPEGNRVKFSLLTNHGCGRTSSPWMRNVRFIFPHMTSRHALLCSCKTVTRQFLISCFRRWVFPKRKHVKLKLITTNSFEMSIIMLKILENTKSADTSINNVECTTNINWKLWNKLFLE